MDDHSWGLKNWKNLKAARKTKEVQAVVSREKEFWFPLNNNQVLYNNLTSVAETNSSEKELTIADAQQTTIFCNPDVRKSKESKLVSYEICFPDFYFSSVQNGWLCKMLIFLWKRWQYSFRWQTRKIRGVPFGKIFRSLKFKLS